MKIILVVTDSRKKNLIFVTNKFQTLSLDEAINLAKDNKIEGVHVVGRSSSTYLRTDKRVPKSWELESLSIPGYLLTSSPINIPAVNDFLKLYHESLRKDMNLLRLENGQLAPVEQVKVKLASHRNSIFDAAKKFDIDPYLIGSILIDEIARFIPYENIYEKLKGDVVGFNASVGVGQVKIDTAYGLIKAGYYNPNPNDSKLSFKRLNQGTRRYLYNYLTDPKHNIFFVAAKIRQLIDEWQKFIDLKKKPEIIATLYSRSYKAPHSDPKPNDRGLQIVEEFYILANEYLNLK